MRAGLLLQGFATIAAHAVYGALLANDLAVAAASGLPLDITITDLWAAGQGYGTTAGHVFTILGCLLAAAWAIAGSWRTPPHWVITASWGGLLALGAPAYFVASFGNLNSVGDAYPQWHPDAAWALEAPLYLASGNGLLAALACLVRGFVARRGRRPAQPATMPPA